MSQRKAWPSCFQIHGSNRLFESSRGWREPTARREPSRFLVRPLNRSEKDQAAAAVQATGSSRTAGTAFICLSERRFFVQFIVTDPEHWGENMLDSAVKKKIVERLAQVKNEGKLLSRAQLEQYYG